MRLKARGHSVEVRTPEWADLLQYEREFAKDDFAAMRNIFKRCRVSGGESIPAALEVSLGGALLRNAGSGAEVRKVEDEFEFPEDLADAMVKYADRGPFHVFQTSGLYVLTREPTNAEMESFWKARDKSQLAAAHSLVKQVTLFVTGSPAEPIKGIEKNCPAAVAGIAVAIADVAGLTIEVEVEKS